MAIYQEILSWSQSRPLFVQDALRRLITSTTINQSDIDELILLIKKECGDTTITLNALPLDNTHIPVTVNSGTSYPKLVSLSDPINICSLHNQATLQFARDGLTVVYGNNGSGKSSYSRILKKLCWSRNPGIELKKNVFNPSNIPQQVGFVIEDNGSDVNLTWTENGAAHALLKSIFVFDTDCGNIYVNNENPTDYKPIGIDVLEGLISIFGSIAQSLDLSLVPYNTTKPNLDQRYLQTSVARWYGTIESLQRPQVDSYIQFSQADVNRKNELSNLTTNQNAQQNIVSLASQKSRINNYVQQLAQIESLFSQSQINEIIANRTSLESISQAYQLATAELSSANLLEGFGTNPWRTLWESAKNFAHSANLSDGENFPSQGSLEQCVLCQQDLSESAQQRMITFNNFVLNDISTQLISLNSLIGQKQSAYNGIALPTIESLEELEHILPNFRSNYAEFCTHVTTYKDQILSHLQHGGELHVNLRTISQSIASVITNIDSQIFQNNQLLQNRNSLVNELNELTAKEILFNQKAAILRYYDEFKFKAWIARCKSQLTTTGISRKIGELMEDQAVNLQHQEFVSHLRFFNRELSEKVLLAKTRTSQGNTFQKCNLNGINHTISSILSEGEQKIVALSNFLAECTIDGRLNTIVFDDPVTSLDMDYRSLIADKIVALAQTRQVVVLTHDLSFLRLLIDTHKIAMTNDCLVIGIDKYNGVSGIVTDEIPYLAKNVQERVDSIRRILTEHDALIITDSHGREVKLDSARKRFRMLLERSVEEILSNKTFERFSKNIHLKKGNLSSYIVTDQSDVDFLLNLFGKYSITEHDGGTSTIPQLPNRSEIETDTTAYSNWKNAFKAKLRTFQTTYN